MDRSFVDDERAVKGLEALGITVERSIEISDQIDLFFENISPAEDGDTICGYIARIKHLVNTINEAFYAGSYVTFKLQNNQQEAFALDEIAKRIGEAVQESFSGVNVTTSVKKPTTKFND